MDFNISKADIRKHFNLSKDVNIIFDLTDSEDEPSSDNFKLNVLLSFKMKSLKHQNKIVDDLFDSRKSKTDFINKMRTPKFSPNLSDIEKIFLYDDKNPEWVWNKLLYLVTQQPRLRN